MMAFFSRIKRYLIAGVGIAAAVAIGLLYICLHVARHAARAAREKSAMLRARLAVSQATAKAARQTRHAASTAITKVAKHSAAQPPPDVEARDDFEGRR